MAHSGTRRPLFSAPLRGLQSSPGLRAEQTGVQPKIYPSRTKKKARCYELNSYRALIHGGEGGIPCKSLIYKENILRSNAGVPPKSNARPQPECTRKLCVNSLECDHRAGASAVHNFGPGQSRLRSLAWRGSWELASRRWLKVLTPARISPIPEKLGGSTGLRSVLRLPLRTRGPRRLETRRRATRGLHRA